MQILIELQKKEWRTVAQRGLVLIVHVMEVPSKRDLTFEGCPPKKSDHFRGVHLRGVSLRELSILEVFSLERCPFQI